MAQKKERSAVLSFLAWFTGVIVSLVVGNAMIAKVLELPAWLGGTTAVGAVITQIIGWIVIITTLVSVIMAILKR